MTFPDESELTQKTFMHVDEFREVVGGKFFTARFVKQNGEIRTIRARLGVKKGLKGGELSYNPSERNNLICWDLEKKAYRTIKFDNLLEIKYLNKTWEIADEL